MFKYSETGHAKNVANFKTLISFCESYGTVYNPSMSHLTKPMLDVLYESASTVVELVRSTKAIEGSLTNQRKLDFDPVGVILKRVKNFLIAYGASEETIKDAQSIIVHVEGKKKSKTEKSPEGNPPENKEEQDSIYTQSHTSFDSKIDALRKIIQLAMTVPTYIPNEQEMSIQGLTSLTDSLASLNIQANQASVAASNARVERDKVLYLLEHNLVDTANGVKKYVLGAFGRNSTQYKQISKLLFTNMPSMQ